MISLLAILATAGIESSDGHLSGIRSSWTARLSERVAIYAEIHQSIGRRSVELDGIAIDVRLGI